MTDTNWQPMIVAVFGGSSDVPAEVLGLARCVGGKISAAGLIVLTGGRLEEQESPKSVKDAALKGADPDGHWIGVLRDGDYPSFSPDGMGGVVFSRMGHQRNFLEASLCDAAIVLKGAKGTISEAVSTICLGKPVLLAGATWTEDCLALYQLFETRDLTADRKKDLVEITLSRLSEGTENGPMRQLIDLAVQPGKIQLHERSRLVSATGPQACPAIADWFTEIQELSQKGELLQKGEFPPIGKEYDTAKEDYRRWLEQLSRPGR